MKLGLLDMAWPSSLPGNFEPEEDLTLAAAFQTPDEYS